MKPSALESDIGRRIRRLRTTQGWSLEAVATKANISRSLLSKVENGRVSSPIATLANIATLIGLLGTIRGLIAAGGAGGHAAPAQRAALLSAGISEAMWNTALGLGIAVLCMIFHLIIHGMVRKIKQDIERSTMKLENLLGRRNAGETSAMDFEKGS